MQTYDNYYANILQKLIEDEINRLTQNIVSGGQYEHITIQRQIGHVVALRVVLNDLMPEADKLSKERN